MADLVLTTMTLAAQAFINAHLPEYFASIDSRLECPQLELGYKDLIGRTKYPAGCFVPIPFQQEDSGNQSSLLSIDVEIGIAIAEPKEDRLSLKLLWITDAILSLIRDEYTLGDSCLESAVVDGTMLQGDPAHRGLGIVFATIHLTAEAAAT